MSLVPGRTPEERETYTLGMKTTREKGSVGSSIMQYVPVVSEMITHSRRQGYDHDENGTGAYSAANTQGRQSEFPHDHSQDDRPNKSHVKKRLLPSEPSPHVIFLGLDTDFTEADVRWPDRFLMHVTKIGLMIVAPGLSRQ
jgi:hypothetical protein